MEDVVQQIHKMMRAGINAKQRAVHLVRNPRQRMPVCLFTGGERPHKIRGTQSRGDMGVTDDVLIVIEIDERVMSDRPVKRRSAERKHETDQREILLSGRRGGCIGFRT